MWRMRRFLNGGTQNIATGVDSESDRDSDIRQESDILYETQKSPPKNSLCSRIWCVGKYFLWVPMLLTTLLVIRLTGSTILCDDSEFSLPDTVNKPVVSNMNAPTTTVAPKSKATAVKQSKQAQIVGVSYSHDGKTISVTNPPVQEIQSICIPTSISFNYTMETYDGASLYEIQLRRSDESKFWYSLTNRSNTFLVENLFPDTTYMIRVRTFHEGIWMKFGDVDRSCKTLPVDETVIRGLTALEHTESSITLTWMPPQKSDVKSYILNKNGNDIPNEGTSAVVSGLKASRTYTFAIIAVFEDGTKGKLSPKYEFKTASGDRTFLEVYRAAPDVDFLADHNSGDLGAIAAQLSFTPSSETPSIVQQCQNCKCADVSKDSGVEVESLQACQQLASKDNMDFFTYLLAPDRKCIPTKSCPLDSQIHDTKNRWAIYQSKMRLASRRITKYCFKYLGDLGDYLSCDGDECSCSTYEDREQGRLDMSDCKQGSSSCTCYQDQVNAALSKVGNLPIYSSKSDEPIGHKFSTPAKIKCESDVSMGTDACMWKRKTDQAFVDIGELVKAGFKVNTSDKSALENNKKILQLKFSEKNLKCCGC